MIISLRQKNIFKKVRPFYLLILPILSILMISCTSISNQSKKSQADNNLQLLNLMNMGNLIGQSEVLINDALGDGKIQENKGLQYQSIDLEKLKVSKYKIYKVVCSFWFVDSNLEEIHISVGLHKAFGSFSKTTNKDDIVKILGKPRIEKVSNTNPRLLILTYRDLGFSLHFILTSKNLDWKGKILQTSNNHIDESKLQLKEIRFTYPRRNSKFISLMEREISKKEKDILVKDPIETKIEQSP
jgi:hypothetical protein